MALIFLAAFIFAVWWVIKGLDDDDFGPMSPA